MPNYNGFIGDTWKIFEQDNNTVNETTMCCLGRWLAKQK